MKHTGPIRRARHTGIRNAQHVPMPLLDQRLGNWQHPPLGETWPAKRPGIAQNHHMVGRDIEIFIINRLFHFRIAVKHQGRTLMIAEPFITGSRFDHRPVRAQIATQNRK